MSSILLVQKDHTELHINAKIFSVRGFEVVCANTIEDCFEKLQKNWIDIILLDMDLSVAEGIKICRELKEKYNLPVFFVSIQGGSDNIVNILRAGADDCLLKPYNMEVMITRIEALLRREAEIKRYICYGNLKLDTFFELGYLFDQDMQLTKKEFLVLLLLIRNAEKYVPAQIVTECIWNSDENEKKQALWTMISRLRKKLTTEKSHLTISSKRGNGYILERA